MKTLTKLFMLATLMVNSASIWAASSAVSEAEVNNLENMVKKAHKDAASAKTKLATATDATRKRLTNLYTVKMQKLEKACTDVCKPVISGKEKFCEQHCTLDKHGHPAEPKPAAREEEHKGAAA